MRYSFLSILMIASAFVAFNGCSDSNDPDTDPENPLEPLEKPYNLGIDSISHETAMFHWEGNSDLYEVEVSGMPSVDYEGTAFGIDGLKKLTDYTWRVRAKRGDEVTDWVEGLSFKTTEFIDVRDKWVGTWYGDNMDLSVMISGIRLTLQDIFPNLPENFDPNEFLRLFELRFDKEGDDESKELQVSSPLLEALELPASFVTGIDKNSIRRDILLSDTITVMNTPIPIADIPYISEILNNIEVLDDLVVNEIQIAFTDLTIFVGPNQEEAIPALFSLKGVVLIKTSDEVVNVLIGVIGNPQASFTVNMDLMRRE